MFKHNNKDFTKLRIKEYIEKNLAREKDNLNNQNSTKIKNTKIG